MFDDAVRIAGSCCAELIILHVRMTWASHPAELRFAADESVYEYAEQQELARLRERVKRANADLQTRLIVEKGPSAGEAICRTATNENADLIVIATHARHHVAHLLVGSTTMSILKDPPAPVLAIRYGIRKRAAMDRVVVPVHLQQTSHRALDLATREAKEVCLLTVCSDQDQSKAETLLGELAARIPGAQTAIVHGRNPDEEIVKHAAKVDADAIFLNAAAAPSKRKIDIIRHAPVPVMIA